MFGGKNELPTKGDGKPRTKAEEEEYMRRYRLQRECQRERSRKQLKEQMWIAFFSFAIIGTYMAVEYGVHTFEIIEKEIWENPHPLVGKPLVPFYSLAFFSTELVLHTEWAGYGVFVILAIWPVWHSIKSSLDSAQNKKRR
jgi:hypothetical protein